MNTRDPSDPNEVFREDKKDKALNAVAALSPLVPFVGGLGQEIASRERTDHQNARLRTFLIDVNERLTGLESQLEEVGEYLRGEDFLDIANLVTDLVAKERSNEKRQLYADFFLGIALSPGDYDKRAKLLKLLEGVDPNQMRVLKAMSEPPAAATGFMSSFAATLERRTGLPEQELTDAVDELNAVRLTNLPSLNVTMTASGAEDLSHAITPLGHQLIELLLQSYKA